MKRVFGAKKSAGPPPPSLGDASTGIGKRVEHLDAKIASLDNELRGYKDKLKTTRAPAAKQNYQKRAMEVLKRKRMYESQREQLAGQQFNIDQAAFGIDSVKDSINTVAAMKHANTQFKGQLKKLNINEVEDVADDLADMMEDMNEMNDALARTYDTPDHIDEADLEAELDMLGDELEEEEMEAATPSYLQEPSLPAQPTGTPGNAVPAGGGRVDEYGLPVHT